eukprot:SAG22_NODE_827_length_6957_cov_4.434821_1_plen_171_part_00
MPGLRAVFAAGFAGQEAVRGRPGAARHADDPVEWRRSGVTSLPDGPDVPVQVLWRLSRTRRGDWQVRIKRFRCYKSRGDEPARRRDEAAFSLATDSMPRAQPAYVDAVLSPDGGLMIFVYSATGGPGLGPGGGCISRVVVPVTVRAGMRGAPLPLVPSAFLMALLAKFKR